MLLEGFNHCYRCDSLWKTPKTNITSCPFCNVAITSNCDVTENSKYFIIKDGILSKYTGNATHVTVPNTVRTIGSFAFEGTFVEKVTLEEGVTSIESDAFSWLESLTYVKLPVSLTSIGKFAFEGCENLTEINLPTTISFIGKDAFADCTKLSKEVVEFIQSIYGNSKN